jgi:hypothetical protein
MVSSGSSIRILYPRESYDFLENPEGSVRTVYQSTTVVSPRPSPVTDHVICKRIVNMFYRLVSQVLNKL